LGQNMNDIKRRIKSVTSTRQITKAMELVATAKLKRARTKLDASKPYFNTVLDSITEIISHTKGIKHPYIDCREAKKTLYIVITGDRGLAGGYNSNVCRLAENEIKEKSDVMIISIGSKGRDYFRRKGYSVSKSYIGVSETPSLEVTKEISEEIIRLYTNCEIDEVYLIYTEFRSTISYEPVSLKLMPVHIQPVTENDEYPVIFRYEPSPEAVLEYLIPKYLNSVIYGACIESSASESGARRIAMENATDNAEEMIDSLQLVYNRARQASITQEITEIVAGADALN
jgi:F-type H+-transporting ATPase subunit gamma